MTPEEEGRFSSRALVGCLALGVLFLGLIGLLNALWGNWPG